MTVLMTALFIGIAIGGVLRSSGDRCVIDVLIHMQTYRRRILRRRICTVRSSRTSLQLFRRSVAVMIVPFIQYVRPLQRLFKPTAATDILRINIHDACYCDKRH